MEITAALAADLALLSEALDEADPDITESLRRFVADVRLAVRSYVGLTLLAGTATFPLTLTLMEDSTHPADVVSSLLMPLSNGTAEGNGVPLAVVLYAARPGAFVDLAADLRWLTDRPLSDFALDQHLSGRATPSVDAQAVSLVNQAIGLLVGRGYTLEQAECEIDARAAAAGRSRSDVAATLLAGAAGDDEDSTRDAR